MRASTSPASPPPAAPAPAEPSPEVVAPDSIWHLVAGCLLLTACLEAGELLQRNLRLILPGNILGLFLLLTLLATRVAPLRWVEAAARWLLWLLPLLFMPIFTLALKDRAFWATQGQAVAGAVVVATLLLWGFVGHLAQFLLRSRARGEHPTRPPGDSAARAPTKTRADHGAGEQKAETPAGTDRRAAVLAWPASGHVATGLYAVGSVTLLRDLSHLVLWSLLTIAVYFACRWVFLKTRWSLLHPGLTGILVMVMILECVGRPYPEYKEATAWINWLLGPAVVAMAVPIYQLREMVRANARVLVGVIPLGLVFAAGSTTLILAAAGRSRTVVAAGALKSITSPVGYRLAVDAHVSTDAALAGILIAGMLGATLGPPLLRGMRVRDERAVGLALGCASHGIGVARAMEIGRPAGAFASLGMSGTAMLGALLLPYLLRRIVGAE